VPHCGQNGVPWARAPQRRVAALFVVALAAAGCSTSVQGSPAPKGAAPAAAGSSGEDASIDACTLLKPEEVQGLIGTNDGGKGTPASTARAPERRPSSCR